MLIRTNSVEGRHHHGHISKTSADIERLIVQHSGKGIVSLLPGQVTCGEKHAASQLLYLWIERKRNQSSQAFPAFGIEFLGAPVWIEGITQAESPSDFFRSQGPVECAAKVGMFLIATFQPFAQLGLTGLVHAL